MKNLIKKIEKSLLLVTMFTVVMGNASEISSFKIEGELKGTALTIEDVKKGDLLSIKSDNGITIYKELIQLAGTYENGFDLTELPNGNYFFEIDKALKIRTIPFSVSSNKVSFEKDKEVIVFKPFVRTKDDLVYITKLALNYEPLKIRIYGKQDGGYHLLRSDKIEGVQSIEKLYKLEKGNYKIELNSNNNKYTRFINN
ncbi:hypothetical protein [Flavivirga jejuensis]|uniref:Secreted protein (Por secretion system target) n=1 Tax=Flavivirga jejuensis TaxID=870487 RepID=A0ABT8WHH7_9FLAO|nr:hypothetical protein [Flavivirga jejuensis]MDO5972617.1 hypothetical protein [Flavivirga jejuensis]